jgi:hypothetical protein
LSRFERILRAVYDIRFLLSVVIVTLLLSILVPIRQGRLTNDRLLQTSNATRQTQLDNTDTNARIKDCVDPNGKCYRAGQSRTAAVAKQLQDFTVIANACTVAVDNGTTSEDFEVVRKMIDSCIKAHMPKG